MKEHNCNHDNHKMIEPCPKKVPIFKELSDEEILKVAKMTKHIHFKKGQALLHEGEKSDKLFIVNKGQVKVSKFTVNGKEQILYILTTGEFFGELHLFNHDEVNNFSVYAIEDTVICLLTKDDIDRIMEANPEIALKLLRAVTKRLAHIENLAQNLATNDAEVRIVQMILEFCQKFGMKKNEGILIELPITREEVASYVGVARETVSRKFSKFEDLGLITLSGNKQIFVKNQLALREYLHLI
ncbi:CRP/FNR family transcriptional regulator, anaerobic regulatory protein [Paenibacillus uliginis N3/975]|uniref:CRP/FNR family transcriptional regulator, anaerobic regulatory protein n=1 Tax=Paenibacillus uliginis N3/975 TaxID=1313296 RepID=A0A1X7HPS0_9BACL|nr:MULTISPECIES: Crp/Fnr family transcriptional regulator [Paenibacillus]UNK19200.1 Crp/Fnr family transcriptional regulator [Paenibacillus sp. N3/727]SMF90760.1 CRP/FNR family transcriptional regulator, anaerobic regulatory protein [Paenibacillus uliginis N3/975]